MFQSWNPNSMEDTNERAKDSSAAFSNVLPGFVSRQSFIIIDIKDKEVRLSHLNDVAFEHKIILFAKSLIVQMIVLIIFITCHFRSLLQPIIFQMRHITSFMFVLNNLHTGTTLVAILFRV